MKSLYALIGGLFLMAPALACEYPEESVGVDELPDGTTATMDEMLDAQEEVRGYVEAMEHFIQCVDRELTARAENDEPLDEAEQERFRVMVERRDAAADEVNAVADEFNEQIRAFQEHNQ